MISKLKPLTWSWEQQDNFQDEVPQLTWIVLKDDYPTCWNKAENWDRPFTCCQKQNQHFELIKQTLRSVTEHKDTWFNLNRLHKAMSGGNYYFSRSPVIRENEVTTTYSSRQCVCIVWVGHHQSSRVKSYQTVCHEIQHFRYKTLAAQAE